VENLVKRYGDVEAVRGVSFNVEEARSLACSGPTAPEKPRPLRFWKACAIPMADASLSAASTRNGNRQPSSMRLAPLSNPLPYRQAARDGGPAALRQFYKRGRKPEELLQRFGLEDKRNAFLQRASGGQKQRLALPWLSSTIQKSYSSMNRPPARSPGSPRDLRHHRELRCEKKTILMTTHYIEEAERLCDRVAIVDHGKVIARARPAS